VKEFNTERGRKLFRKEMVEHLWPNAVKERVKRKLEGLDLEADEIQQDDKKFFEFVKTVVEENERVFGVSKKGNSNLERRESFNIGS
jgi:predicted metallo-beta-lactamase superfamily hydrolase